jgi:AcrR family transcriptional regulator
VDTILSEALRLFAAKGYDATSVREIAEAARVAKPTIYYYFESKEGLLGRLLDERMKPLTGGLREINERPVQAGALECMADTVWLLFRFAMDNADLIRFIHMLAFGPRRQPAQRAVERGFLEMVGEFRRLLMRAAREGVMDESRVDEAALAFRGVTTTCVVAHLHGRMPLSRKLAARLVDGFLYGYAGERDRKAVAR